MMFIFSLVMLLSTSLKAMEVRKWSGSEGAVKEDLRLIEKKAAWPQGVFQFSFSKGDINQVEILCSNQVITLKVSSKSEEQIPTLYHGLFKLGFYFPHPRWQITPQRLEADKQCGKTFEWRPAFDRRGFHLHTLHPNEWVKGFLEGDEAIALDTVRWVARNRQNVLDLSLLRPKWHGQMASLKKPFSLAKDFGISRGVSLGSALQQQNSYKLIPLVQAVLGRGDEAALLKNTRELNRNLDYDFMTMEIGTSEFTSVKYERALKWINLAAEEIKPQGKKVFTKIHVSTNMVSPVWGNFNFIPRFADPDVGLMPHTVMFYSLSDKSAPMYGNKNFNHMQKFIDEEKDKRDIWYYPETSYWVFMDQDAPLFLTDYLTARADDMRNLTSEIQGHFNFTSGHELGYWLFDWTLALNSDLDQNFDPTSGLKLLGEDIGVWQKIMDFQTKFFKEKQIISILSFSNLQDEISRSHRIHDRYLMREIAASARIRESEIKKLEECLEEVPDVSGIKNEELRLLLETTELRIRHALAVRKSLRARRNSPARAEGLLAATNFRLQAKTRLDSLRKNYSRYPTAKLFERRNDLTSYSFGSLFTAGSLYFWQREEDMIKANRYDPFFQNIVNFIDVLF